jgi:hypothetical protein
MVYFDDFQQSPQDVYHIQMYHLQGGLRTWRQHFSTSPQHLISSVPGKTKPEPDPTYEAALPYPKSENHAYALYHPLSMLILLTCVQTMIHNTLYQYKCHS